MTTTGILFPARSRTLWVGITGVTALAWIALILTHGHAHAAGQADWRGAGLGTLAILWLQWMAMMVAMMLPPVAPWIRGYSNFGGAVTGWEDRRDTFLFAVGYFAVWSLYAAAASGAQWGLATGGILLAGTARLPGELAGTLLVLVGAYQWSPLKNACLSHCRSPIGFFLNHWKEGSVGSLGMGFRHGLFCLGCCWALMALAFALGIDSLFWMAIITLVICLEQLGGSRWGGWVTRVSGTLLAGLGVILLW